MSKIAKLLLPFLGILLSFVMIEAFLRLVYQFYPPEDPPRCIRVQVICDLYERYDPHGYRLKPSHSEYYYYPYFSPNRRRLLMNSNEYGFRSSRAFDDQDERFRIIVLGDSQTFGEGVEESERFSNLLESNNPKWRVDNLAMNGYGPDLMLMALESVGIDLNPDVVILAIFADDFRRVNPYYAGTGFEIPRFTLRSGELVRTPHPELQIWDQMLVTWAVRNAYWEYSNAERKLNNAILDRFITLANQHTFTLVVVFLPYEFGTQEKRLEAEENRTWLRSYSEQHAIPFLDLTDTISNASWKRIRVVDNVHFNPYGHEIIASELSRFLNEQVATID